jgi:hypothetical protein
MKTNMMMIVFYVLVRRTTPWTDLNSTPAKNEGEGFDRKRNSQKNVSNNDRVANFPLPTYPNWENGKSVGKWENGMEEAGNPSKCKIEVH